MNDSSVAELTKTNKVKIQKDDVLVKISHEIENLSAEDSINVVPELLNNADENYFRLGGVLSSIQAHKYFETEEGGGFENFKSFVEERYGLPYRRAMYWIGIYNAIIKSGVSWNKVKDVGWTKLKDLAAILDEENVDEWVARAQKLTTLQLQEAIKKATAGTLESSGEEAEETTTTTMTFKVHTDQKATIQKAIDKAKGEANTTVATVALEAICLNYLSGGKVTKPASLKDTFKKYTPEEILSAFSDAHPNIHVTASIKTGKNSD